MCLTVTDHFLGQPYKVNYLSPSRWAIKYMKVWMSCFFILGKKTFCTSQTHLEHYMRDPRFALPWKLHLWVMIPYNLVHGSQGVYRRWRQRVPPKRRYSSATPYGFKTRKFIIWTWTSTVMTVNTEMWSLWSGYDPACSTLIVLSIVIISREEWGWCC